MTGVELHVSDFAPVRAFYARLGFETVWEQAPDGHKGYLVLRCENNVIRFWCGNDSVHDHPYFKTFSTAPPGKGVELVLEVENLDALYERLKDDPCLLEPLQQKPWGLRDFRIKDPSGYYLRLTTPHDILAGSDYIIP